MKPSLFYPVLVCCGCAATLAVILVNDPVLSTRMVFINLLLLGVILVTTLSTFFAQRKRLVQLHAELAKERDGRQDLQRQFEQTIEQRTFELQRVNGSLHREIAERIQVEEEVRELQKQLTLILDSAGEGILGLDNQGKVVFVNRSASLMLGWEMEDLIGHRHHEMIHHSFADGTPHPVERCPIYMAYHDGLVHFNSDDVFWCKNGTSFPVEYVSTPIRDRGMLTGAVVVFRDMNTFT
ncbi:MAG: PAS domain S-box protein [Desulforhopalus sp.]